MGQKAAILATAWHDFAQRDYDGVGMVVASAADDTYKNGRFVNDSAAGGLPLTPANFVSSCAPVAGTNCRRFDNRFTATSGAKVRVAIAWDSWSTGGGGTDVLGADIDFFVVAPDNLTVQPGFNSAYNAWEIVEFTAPATGSYDIILKLSSSAAGWPGTYLGRA